MMDVARQLHFRVWLACSALLVGSAFAQSDPPSAEPPSPAQDDTASASSADSTLNFEKLEAQGAVIGEIRINNVNVFDLNDPDDNKALFRLANRLHARTKAEVIRQQLLFKPGDPISARQIHESERLLRANNYLVDAQIRPVRYANGVVDIDVRTQDVWTLNPGINLGRSGGKNSYSFKLEDANLLGYGKDVQVNYESDVDRSSSLFLYSDPRFLGSWNQLLVSHAINSDGSRSEAAFTRPFYALDTRWAAGGGALHWDRIDSRYDLGDIVDQYRHDEFDYVGYFGLSSGLNAGKIQRWTFGVNYSRDQFKPDPLFTSPVVLPNSRTLSYPFVGFELLEDRFVEARNEMQIGRTEDLYEGPYLQAVLGWASRAWGSNLNAVIVGFSAGDTLRSPDSNKRLALGVDGYSRIENGGLANASLSLNLESYWRFSPRQLSFASLFAVTTHNLDKDRQLLLGGDNAGLSASTPHNPTAGSGPLQYSEESLRGYPLRYQDGQSLALLTLEHRIYTDYYLFRLFRIGGAAFFDMGRTWGRGTAGGESLGWLKDVGVGFRLGSTRSAFGNVIHVDVAFPLDRSVAIDSVQFVVKTKRSF